MIRKNNIIVYFITYYKCEFLSQGIGIYSFLNLMCVSYNLTDMDLKILVYIIMNQPRLKKITNKNFTPFIEKLFMFNTLLLVILYKYINHI